MNGRKDAKRGDEKDAVSRYWRSVLIYMGRPGVTKKIKRRMNKRARQTARKSTIEEFREL